MLTGERPEPIVLVGITAVLADIGLVSVRGVSSPPVAAPGPG